jgi:hypothetical protein
MNDAAIRSIQTKLQELGFYQGEIDGIVGPQTKRGLREFYRAQADLVGQGKLLAASASQFDLSADDIQRVRGEDDDDATTGGPSTSMPGMGRSGNSTTGAGSATQPGSSMGTGTTQGTSGTPGAGNMNGPRRRSSTQGTTTLPSDTNATQGTTPSQGTGTTQGTSTTPGTMPGSSP